MKTQRVNMDETDQENDSRVFVESENVSNMNWEEFLVENLESGMSEDESTYIASVETGASSEDVNEEDNTSVDDEDNTSKGKKSHLMRSFKGKKHLYELDESSEEEDLEDHGFNTRDIDTSDEEFQMVRQKVIEYKAEVEKQEKEQLSEYEDSDGEMEMICENEDDQDVLMRRTRRELTIGPKTDFKDFAWKVGLRFPNMEIFKEAVRRYGIYNGYSLGFGVCDKNRGKVGAICKNGCPFKIYGSWHEKEGCIIVKSANTEHCCVRDMQKKSPAYIERMVAKQKLMKDQEEHAICPRIKLKLEEEKVKAWELGVSPSSLTVFQVREIVDVFKVDIQHHSCTCKKWDITGIPCHHVVAAICYLKLRPESFVHSLYKKETYLKAYAKGIEPCVSEKFWPKVNFPLDPPPLKIQPGRPKNNRRKCPHEDPKKKRKTHQAWGYNEVW